MRTASPADRCIADAVHAIASHMPNELDPVTQKPCTRYGHKVFISAIWSALQVEWKTTLADVGLHDLAGFKRWLLQGMLQVDQQGRPLALLARADLVGAMHYPAVQASEISDRGAEFHFLVDRFEAAAEYNRFATGPVSADDTKPYRRCR